MPAQTNPVRINLWYQGQQMLRCSDDKQIIVKISARVQDFNDVTGCGKLYAVVSEKKALYRRVPFVN